MPLDLNPPPVGRKTWLPFQLCGDQMQISSDTSLYRHGSGWNWQSGSTGFTLVGGIVMEYISHNAPIDGNGNFLGRDDNGACYLWTYGEDENIRIYGAPQALPGVKPVWTLYRQYNALTGAETFVGSIIPSQTVGITGTTTNNSAQAGSVGEYITATVVAGSAVALTTATGANITSISLTAGDWDVSAVADFTPGATTSITVLSAGLGTTTATLLGQAGGGGVGTDPLVTITQPATVPAAGPLHLALPPTRVLIASTTTIFFVANCTFTVSTLSAYGTIRARRIR